MSWFVVNQTCTGGGRGVDPAAGAELYCAQFRRAAQKVIQRSSGIRRVADGVELRRWSYQAVCGDGNGGASAG